MIHFGGNAHNITNTSVSNVARNNHHFSKHREVKWRRVRACVCARACRVMKLEKSDEPGERAALPKGLHPSYSPGPCVTVGTIRLLM